MSNRNVDLAKIHLGKKQLDMEEDTYRDLLWTIARVKSSADLDEYGRKKVIDHMRKCGVTFTRPKRIGQRPHNYNQLPEYITKVEALLADMDLSWAYADTIARNITGGKGHRPGSDPGVEKLAWVKRDQHWRDIIAALAVEQEKRGKYATIQTMLEERALDEAYVVALLEANNRSPKNWHRNRKVMGRVIEHLLTVEIPGND